MASSSTPLAGIVLPVAVIALALGLLAALLVGLAGPGSRLGWWHWTTAFGVLRWGSYAAMAALVAAIVAGLVAGLGARWGLLSLAVLALVLGAVALSGPLLLRAKARGVPRIHDISTDTDHPPAFQAVLPLREGARNPPDYDGPEVAAQQHSAYPDIVPLYLRDDPAAVMAAAVAAARTLGWDVVASDAATGRMEAVVTSAWFGFKDDVVVRVRSEDTGTRLDVRSKSRLGLSDLGANAARIRAYLAALREAGLKPVR